VDCIEIKSGGRKPPKYLVELTVMEMRAIYASLGRVSPSQFQEGLHSKGWTAVGEYSRVKRGLGVKFDRITKE
tara:strand:- start:133 stop:351 length:219 start_codon:yes stop_codon:yes gene_type:complete